MRQTIALTGLAVMASSVLQGQVALERGEVNDLYQQYCVSCHGERGEGGLGGSLIDDQWRFGASDEAIAKVIREGIPELGMVPYGKVLSEEQIRSMVVFVRELRLKNEREVAPPPGPAIGDTVESRHHSFKIETVTSKPDDAFWSVNFLPDGGLVLSGFKGNVYFYQNGTLSEPVAGTPEVWFRSQGGLLDVVPHPDYAENGWLYLSFAESSGEDEEGRKVGATTIVRGRVVDGQWQDEAVIYRTDEKFHTRAGHHFGCRLAFHDGYLYFSIGDRGRMENAQALDNPFGKIHRVYDDGRVPEDNPYVNQEDALPTIWTYGNRNPQGLAIRPSNGELWQTEHGPRGGDELNLLKKGNNYGWPTITYGINYNGRPISGQTEAPGMEQPVMHWTPSIAICGMDFLSSTAFPAWDGNLFLGGLSSQQLHRIVLDGGKVAEEEILFRGLGGVRDIAGGPDGFLYAAVNRGRDMNGSILRLVPVAPEQE